VTTTLDIDIDAAKDRLVDSLTTARDAGAAALSSRTHRRTRRKRWPILVAGLGLAAAIVTFLKQRERQAALIDISQARPASHDTPTADVAESEGTVNTER
jgi:hypothetical protein